MLTFEYNYFSNWEYWAALSVFRRKSKSRRDRADESDDRITIPISLTTLIVRWWQRNPPNSVLHLWFVWFCLLNLSFLFWYFLVSFVTAGCTTISLKNRRFDLENARRKRRRQVPIERLNILALCVSYWVAWRNNHNDDKNGGWIWWWHCNTWRLTIHTSIISKFRRQHELGKALK